MTLHNFIITSQLIIYSKYFYNKLWFNLICFTHLFSLLFFFALVNGSCKFEFHESLFLGFLKENLFIFLYIIFQDFKFFLLLRTARHRCHAPCTMNGPAGPAKMPCTTHARPSLPVNQNTNPTPPNRGAFRLNDTAAHYLPKITLHSFLQKTIMWTFSGLSLVLLHVTVFELVEKFLSLSQKVAWIAKYFFTALAKRGYTLAWFFHRFKTSTL